jgi:hypothetical protein
MKRSSLLAVHTLRCSGRGEGHQGLLSDSLVLMNSAILVSVLCRDCFDRVCLHEPLQESVFFSFTEADRFVIGIWLPPNRDAIKNYRWPGPAVWQG